MDTLFLYPTAIYFIVLLGGSTITFICETCVGLRFEKDVMSRHLEVEEAVTALKLLRARATLTDHQTTTAKVVQDPPIPINSKFQSSPVIINETSDHRSGLSRSKPANVKSVCHFGDKCRFTHPRHCVGSLKNNTSHRKKYFLYYVTGSSRPNLPKNNRVNEKPKATHVQYLFDGRTYYLN